MSLLKGIARSAAVGTAKAVSSRVARRQAGQGARNDQQQYANKQQDPDPHADEAPRQDDMSTKIKQLKQLGALKEQGVLTEAEFNQQKSRVLGSSEGR